jgi:hypothetical protein
MLLKMARTRRRRISFVRNVRRTIVEATYPAISDKVTMGLNLLPSRTQSGSTRKDLDLAATKVVKRL